MPRRSAVAGALVALLAGCGALSDRGGEGPVPTRLSTTGRTVDDAAFPNLGSVPGRPPATSSAGERQAITDKLEADRAKARSGAGGADDRGDTVLELDALAPSGGGPDDGSGGGALPAGPGDQAAALPPGGGAVTVDLGAIDAVAAPLPAAMLPAAAPEGSAPPAALSPGGLSPEGLSPVALIYFDNGSAALSRRGRAVLRDVALLQNRRGAVVRIVGHASMRTRTTDPASHEAVNRAISLRRAKAVARDLARLGVPASRMTVAAAGDDEPVYYEFMPSGEAGNRRVAIYFLH